jgi:hypothetical protein
MNTKSVKDFILPNFTSLLVIILLMGSCIAEDASLSEIK